MKHLITNLNGTLHNWVCMCNEHYKIRTQGVPFGKWPVIESFVNLFVCEKNSNSFKRF